MSLRYQINLRILLNVIIILLLGAVAAVWQARSSITEEVHSSVNLALQLIKLGMIEEKPGDPGQNLWLHNIVSLEQTRHVQIRVKKGSGQLLHIQSKPANQSMGIPPDWFIWAVSSNYPSITYPVETVADRKVLIIISADPFDEIREAWLETRSFFLVILMLGAGLFLAVNLAFKQVLNSVKIILQGVNAIEKEQYKNRLPSFGTLEFDQIARAIDHLTETLEKTREENNALTLHSLEIQEEERKHMAHELHDELSQSITAIKVMAVTGKRTIAESQTINESIIALCNHMFTVVRAMMKTLHPLSLSELGLKASLEDLITNWMMRNPEIEFQLTCAAQIDDMEHKAAIQVFRVIQEGITNTVRHAQARKITIAVELENSVPTNSLALTIKDDGVGCKLSEIKPGYGLRGIKARITSLGGRVDIVSDVSQGMAIYADIPIS